MEIIKSKGISLTKDEYFSNSAVNSSSVKKLIDVYKKIKNNEIQRKIFNGELELLEKYFTVEEKQGKSSYRNLAIGSAIHDICLEGIDRSEAIKNNSVDYTNKKDLEIIELCCDRFAELNLKFENSVIEKCFFKNFRDIELKAKIDAICEIDGKNVIVDLKTINNCNSISVNINRYHYWFQCLYYKLLIDDENCVIDDLWLVFISKDKDDEVPAKIVKFSEIPAEIQEIEFSLFYGFMNLYHELKSFYRERDCQISSLKKILHI